MEPTRIDDFLRSIVIIGLISYRFWDKKAIIAKLSHPRVFNALVNADRI